MCAKHYENPTMLSAVTVKNLGDVFSETQCNGLPDNSYPDFVVPRRFVHRHASLTLTLTPVLTLTLTLTPNPNTNIDSNPSYLTLTLQETPSTKTSGIHKMLQGFELMILAVLFQSLLHNPEHTLHQLLPERRHDITHSLRPRRRSHAKSWITLHI